MSRAPNAQKVRWLRRAKTIHNKAVELCNDLEEKEGKSERWDQMMNVVCVSAEALNAFGYKHNAKPT